MTRLRCAVFSVAALVLFGATRVDAAVILKISGEITSDKILTVYGYAGDGEISEEDFTAVDFLIGSQELQTNGGGTTDVEIEFDITDFLDSLPDDFEWVGFNFRESESGGSVVTIEYLVLGTFLSLALVEGVANVNTQTGVVGPISTMPLPHDINNPPGPTETRGVVEFRRASVPEPSAALVWLIGGGCLAMVRARRRRHAAGA